MRRVLSMALAVVLTICLLPFSSLPVRAAGGIVTTWTGVNEDLYRYHTHTKGSGIPIIIMPVHFGAAEIAQGGRLQTASKWAADLVLDSADNYFFAGMSDYFDVYVYLESDPNGISPVPDGTYDDMAAYIQYEKAFEIAKQKIGGQDIDKKTFAVALGNCDNTGQIAGQIGGWALSDWGAELSWGNDPDGNPWQDDPVAWALHEFWGHGFASFLDEYDNSYDPGPAGAISANTYVSPQMPSNTSVPWRNFIGFEETGGVNGDTYTHGIYKQGGNNSGSNRYHATIDNFMDNHGEKYVPMYHRWVIYKQVMEYAGTSKTLADFCTFMGITLPGGTGGGSGDFGPNPPTGVFDVKGAATAMYVFLLLSVALWGCIFLRRRTRNG